MTKATHDHVVSLLTGSPDIDVVVHRMSVIKNYGNSVVSPAVTVPSSSNQPVLPASSPPGLPASPPPALPASFQPVNIGQPQQNGIRPSNSSNNKMPNSDDKKESSASSSEEDSEEESDSDDESVKNSAIVQYAMEPLAKATSLRNINARAADKPQNSTNQSVVVSNSRSGQPLHQSRSVNDSFENQIEPQTSSRLIKQPGTVTDKPVSDAQAVTNTPAAAGKMVSPPAVSAGRTFAINSRISAVEGAPVVATWAPPGPTLMPPSPVESTVGNKESSVKPLATSSMKHRVDSVTSEDTSVGSSVSPPFVSKVSSKEPPSPIYKSSSKQVNHVSSSAPQKDAVSQLFKKLENQYVAPPVENGTQPQAKASSSAVEVKEPYPVEVH